MPSFHHLQHGLDVLLGDDGGGREDLPVASFLGPADLELRQPLLSARLLVLGHELLAIDRTGGRLLDLGRQIRQRVRGRYQDDLMARGSFDAEGYGEGGHCSFWLSCYVFFNFLGGFSVGFLSSGCSQVILEVMIEDEGLW